MTARKLGNDVARCAGDEADGEWREGCEDCLRRPDRRPFPLHNWMAPPPIIVFECEYRIPPAALQPAPETAAPAARGPL